MLDIKLIRAQPDEIKKALLKRMEHLDFTGLLQWDDLRRELLTESETLKAQRNKVSAQIPALKKDGKDVSSLFKEMKSVAQRIKEIDDQITGLQAKIQSFLEELPNIPADDVPAGGKENNQVVRSWGHKPRFDFDPKDHMELVTSLGLIDYERGVKMGGNGYWLYRGQGAVLEWALLNYFVETHLKNGYEFILPPHLLIYRCGYTAGQFPKFSGDVFQIKSDKEDTFDHFLLPTAETALINFHRDEILKQAELPKKYFAFTPCYRREAGSYRAQERGMIRGHQFNKVELFQFTTPEQSEHALEEMLTQAEQLVQGLGLHYQVSKLAAKDCSAAMAKTYDIELWIPSMDQYKEISSASHAHDYQARRGNIRYKPENQKRSVFIHSLNASGLATSRLIPAIVEQFQQQDGSVIVPEVLSKWLGNTVLKPK